ncbi:class I glutamine amidotransferase [Pyrrhoderma noxium]|uniref:Class I glutamine amidotransferase n=1 Tax=Pyrrhoderma noxium TaxID=2282107 RepID=A0A286UEU5_9AGAM|nr:class I glutamine amidotransferase [Pyrrhoderma noxium]
MSTNTEFDIPPNATKLALLICDTPVPAVLERDGTYHDVYHTWLRITHPKNDIPSESTFILEGFDVKEQIYPNLDSNDYSGILISGSAASAYEDKPWINKLVSWVGETAKTHPDIKLIGICFGHQIISRAMGGTCVRNNGKWELGTTDIDLSPIGQIVLNTDRKSIPIQQVHADHVPFVPPTFHSIGSSPTTPVQGLVRFYPSTTTTTTSSSSSSSSSSDPDPDPSSETTPAPSNPSDPSTIQILTIQGHPEFTKDIVSSIIDAREGILGPDVVADGRARAGREHEGLGVLGRAVWRVLLARRV